MSTTRREFLAAAATTLAGTMAAAAVQEPKPLPIVDTHQHLWDLSRFKLPWIQKDSPLARSFVMKDYLTAVDGLNVVKAVYMEVDVDPSPAGGRGGLCHRHLPARQDADGGRGCFRPARPRMISPNISIASRATRSSRALRQVLHGQGTPAGFCLGADFVRGIRLLGERRAELRSVPARGGAARRHQAGRGLSRHALHSRPLRQRQRPGQGPHAMAARHDPVRQVQERRLQGVRHRRLRPPRKWTADDLAPIVNHTIEAFGRERVMFGGDWPVCTLAATFRQWVDALKTIVRNRPEAEHASYFMTMR